MPQSVDEEIDDFMRWLALMPHHFAEFRQNPDKVMNYAKLSDLAQSTLRSKGREASIQEVRDKLDSILTSPQAKKPMDFARDFKAGGYGGKVIKKGPDEG